MLALCRGRLIEGSLDGDAVIRAYLGRRFRLLRRKAGGRAAAFTHSRAISAALSVSCADGCGVHVDCTAHRRSRPPRSLASKATLNREASQRLLEFLMGNKSGGGSRKQCHPVLLSPECLRPHQLPDHRLCPCTGGLGFTSKGWTFGLDE